MIKRVLTLVGVLVLALAALPQQAQEKSGTVRVQINYTGTGTVDEGHKIFVALWDSPDFAQPNGNVRPVAVKYVTSKNGIVSFSDVQKTPAYVSAAYDPTGNWDGQSGPPPTGTSVGMYSNAPPKPEAIDVGPGKSPKVTITFDDTHKIM
jgi:hypothetical protein